LAGFRTRVQGVAMFQNLLEDIEDIEDIDDLK
jgi:hypothetical protein